MIVRICEVKIRTTTTLLTEFLPFYNLGTNILLSSLPSLSIIGVTPRAQGYRVGHPIAMSNHTQTPMEGPSTRCPADRIILFIYSYLFPIFPSELQLIVKPTVTPNIAQK